MLTTILFCLYISNVPLISTPSNIYQKNDTCYNIERYRVIDAKISAYNAEESQTDSTPTITASGKTVNENFVANNCLKFGTKVSINNKIYYVEDTMNKRYGCEFFDIFLWSYDEAIEWGVKKIQVKIYE